MNKKQGVATIFGATAIYCGVLYGGIQFYERSDDVSLGDTPETLLTAIADNAPVIIAQTEAMTAFCAGLSDKIKEELGATVDDYNLSTEIHRDHCVLSSDNLDDIWFSNFDIENNVSLTDGSAGALFAKTIEGAARNAEFCASFNSVVAPMIAQSGVSAPVLGKYDNGDCMLRVNDEHATQIEATEYNDNGSLDSWRVKHMAMALLDDMDHTDRVKIADNLPSLINSAFD